MAITIKIAVYTNSDDAFVAWAPDRFHFRLSWIPVGAGSRRRGASEG